MEKMSVRLVDLSIIKVDRRFLKKLQPSSERKFFTFFSSPGSLVSKTDVRNL